MGMERAKTKSRLARKVHIRKKVSGTLSRPRLSLFKSNLRLYLQVIDDLSGKTLVSASSLEKDFRLQRLNVKCGEELGVLLGERLKSSKLSKIVFDRNGYKYHGIVKAIADAVRRSGIEF